MSGQRVVKPIYLTRLLLLIFIGLVITWFGVDIKYLDQPLVLEHPCPITFDTTQQKLHLLTTINNSKTFTTTTTTKTPIPTPTTTTLATSGHDHSSSSSSQQAGSVLFNKWIKGLGNSQISNDEFDHCQIPNVPAADNELPAELFHSPDLLFHEKRKGDTPTDECGELIEVSKYERYILLNMKKCKLNLKKIWYYESPSILRGNVRTIIKRNEFIPLLIDSNGDEGDEGDEGDDDDDDDDDSDDDGDANTNDDDINSPSTLLNIGKGNITNIFLRHAKRRLGEEDSDKINDKDHKVVTEIDNGNMIIFPLGNLTQTVWFKVWEKVLREDRDPVYRPHYLHYVSFLPLKIKNPRKYQEQLDKYHKYNYQAKPIMPNVIIYVSDSTSRANFLRATPSAVNFIERTMKPDQNISAHYDENTDYKQNCSSSGSGINSHNSSSNPCDGPIPWFNTIDEVPYGLLQFFRHSTVGWGTGHNMMSIVNGGEEDGIKNQIDLFEYFDKMGYIVPAIDEYLAYLDYVTNGGGGDDDEEKLNVERDHVFDKSQWDQTGGRTTFYLTRNVFPPEMGGIVFGLLQTPRFVDFVLDIVNNVQQNYDNDLPYFMLVHHDDNHHTDGLNEFYSDRYVSKLVEYLHFDRTLFHMTADHGNLIGHFVSTQYGNWESKNPNSLLFFPKYLVENAVDYNNDKYENKVFSVNNLRNMYINQQRFISHYDVHFFWKYFIYKYIDQDKIDLREDILKVINDSMIGGYGMKHVNIMEDIVSINRSCPEAIYNSNSDKSHTYMFCFCDMPTNIPMEFIDRPALTNRNTNTNTDVKSISTSPSASDHKFIHDANEYYNISHNLLNHTINEINYYTGDGKFDCNVLDVNNFKVIEYLESEMHIYLTIEEQYHDDKYITIENYNQLKKETRVLQFRATFETSFIYKKDLGKRVYGYEIRFGERDEIRVPLIERTSYFKYEECIKNDYQVLPWKKIIGSYFGGVSDKIPVIFKNANYTIELYKSVEALALRLCSCKDDWSLAVESAR